MIDFIKFGRKCIDVRGTYNKADTGTGQRGVVLNNGILVTSELAKRWDEYLRNQNHD